MWLQVQCFRYISNSRQSNFLLSSAWTLKSRRFAFKRTALLELFARSNDWRHSFRLFRHTENIPYPYHTITVSQKPSTVKRAGGGGTINSSGGVVVVFSFTRSGACVRGGGGGGDGFVLTSARNAHRVECVFIWMHCETHARSGRNPERRQIFARESRVLCVCVCAR